MEINSDTKTNCLNIKYAISVSLQTPRPGSDVTGSKQCLCSPRAGGDQQISSYPVVSIPPVYQEKNNTLDYSDVPKIR